jgi:hypothetical protein
MNPKYESHGVINHEETPTEYPVEGKSVKIPADGLTPNKKSSR